ncbi:Small nuclear ribonucleoprotein SMD1 and related snRNPs [Plasmopara halstedii]|uniref:Small nuclear ribonucleoprotein SMD1 and related snRNPs n=1 Tax=Plasmopara halstedii TaxID=4781 RepID=A0A0N7L3K1_PLAHL|nr:Small nuclear ribonucleoprotein SMD1 and related snRNPs [Plasmopara halstedii]CEG36099.1 Small nuclear ribonucleoprotein SMD1 and related snRNPs [Plasmopara halstedii]|eukprot:XP_024572468.1 Small nuclear ribonucleoprotein SMD1 and related snRNPs [Plasmopara halstedii]
MFNQHLMKATVRSQDLIKSKRKQRKPRSLLLLLKSFVGLRVRIDLKNDSVLEGVVEEVVQDMDFTLLDACETKPNGTCINLDEVFVMGKTVLYVHIPDRINISQHLQQYTRMVRQSAMMYTRAKRSTSSM